MYLNYYNLTFKPFEISPDPKFLWLGEKHEEALAALKYGILDNKGFISLTGDVGTGKTTLVNALANSLGDNTIFAQVSDPSLEQLDFLNLTADALKMNKKFSTRGDFLSHLRHFLNNAYVHHKQVVLVFEEAQRFDQERLEEVRLISNIEKPDKKLINIVFVGQNEFNSILIKNKALRQRHAIIHNIEPLQEFETEQYVMHRLKVAGSERKIFSPEAVREIYSFSEGNPRLINIICDSALLTGYAKEKKIIEPEIIRECAADYLLPKQQKEDAIEDLRASSKSIPETGTGIQPDASENSYQQVVKKERIKPAGRKFVYGIPMFVFILLSIFGYLYFFGENHAFYRNLKIFLKELKGAKERVVALKGELATKDQALSQFEQKVAELAEELDREKKGQDLLRAELSTKADLVAEVQQKLAAALARQAELLSEIEKSRKEIAELKIQLKGLKAQQASGESAAASVEVKPKPTPASDGSGKQGESPNPADAIDGALQKKAK
jgi:type II secretory pathway predicted ATPase ExeA